MRGSVIHPRPGQDIRAGKGARRPKSPFEAALDLLSICRVVFICKSSDSLDVLTEAKLERRFRTASRDLLRLNCGYYLAELLDRLTDKGDPQADAYDLARATLTAFEDSEADPRALVLRMELQLLRIFGHLPSWQRCVHCGTEIRQAGEASTAQRQQPKERIASSPLQAGQAISSVQSASEDSTLPATPWILFSSLAGGVLCQDCRHGARQTIRFDSDVLDTFIDFSRGDWERINVNQFPRNQGSIIRKVMVQYLTTMLSRPLNLHAYLEELGR